VLLNSPDRKPSPAQEAAMLTLQRTPTRRTPDRNRNKDCERAQTPPTAVPAEQVRRMLREIAFVLHATRVIGRRRRASVNEVDLYVGTVSPRRGSGRTQTATARCVFSE
jgi:hypothetical protein